MIMFTLNLYLYFSVSNLIFKYKSTNENKYQEMQNPKVALKHSGKIALGSLGTVFHREEDKRANRRNPIHKNLKTSGFRKKKERNLNKVGRKKKRRCSN